MLKVVLPEGFGVVEELATKTLLCQKRRILKLLLSNCKLNAGIVHYEYMTLFDLMINIPEREKISG